ncbi:unnamed protein product, partial [Brenthis ino]
MFSHNNRFSHEISEHVSIRPELPRLVFEEVADEDKIEEQIQNSGNIVANIKDITLQEPTLPENRILLDDGFGELNPDQAMQFLDRTVEMMLVQETSVQHSGLDLPVDISYKSQDRSRLIPHEAQMERISEHDMSVFRKSMGAEIVAGDLEKDILDIPEIPPPIAPESHNVEKELPVDVTEREPLKGNELEELMLQDLEPQTKKRKLKQKLIIDKKTRLSSSFIRSRIENNKVELRCEDSAADLAPLVLAAGALLREAARGAARPLADMFARAVLARRDIEEPLPAKTRTFQSRSMLEKIDEEVEPVERPIDNAPDLSKQPQISDIMPLDISEMPTQKILTESQARKRTSEIEISPKRQRKSGFMSYRLHQTQADISNIEANKENVPVEPTDVEANKENVPAEHPDVDRLTAMIQSAGLADRDDVQNKQGSDSETQLGSLDRTKVSLGDSERTTDSKKFIREEWGTAGTMYKIYKYVNSGVSVTVDSLMCRGPVLAGHKRLIAARCFTSILKLKQHGFIIVHKDSVTQEIINIELGEKILRKRK